MEYVYYGNNIDFSDDMLSGMSSKEFVGRWMSNIMNDICLAVWKYHASEKDGNIDTGSINYMNPFFEGASDTIKSMVRPLEDLFAKEISGIEDMIIAIYGLKSSELRIYREYSRLQDSRSNWDTDYMWQGFDDKNRWILKDYNSVRKKL